MKKNQSPEMIARDAQRQRLARAATRPKKRAHTTTLPKQSARQQQGTTKEELAAVFLQQQGLCILEKNAQNRFGEIDIVARSGSTLVIIEVRYRSQARYGGARSSVCSRKQQRIKRTTTSLLPQWSHRYFEGQLPFCRFDVIAFEGESLLWIQDAFR